MKSNKLICALASVALLASSCANDFEKKANNEWSTDYVWSVASMARGVLIKVYTEMQARPDSYDGNFLDAATDNATTVQNGNQMDDLANGAMNVNNNPIGCWSNAFKQFQNINMFLENGLTDKTLYNRLDAEIDAKLKTRYRAEAHFLRAYWGFRLLQVYGGKTDSGVALGYPLNMHFVTEEQAEDLASWSRATYAECAAQIISDCDSAAMFLPAVYAGNDPVTGASFVGSATSVAAMALKSRVALYAASPAFQSDDVADIVRMGEYTVVDEAKYNEGWLKAAVAAEQTMKSFGYQFSALTDTNLADAPAATPAEFILRTYFNNNELEGRHFPPYYNGDARTVPSQNLVDAFPMADGYPSDESPLYSESDPYANRDNRFALNVYAHGATFGKTGAAMDVTESGKDSPQSFYNASRTGYYLAKFLSKNEAMLNPIAKTNSVHYYALLRRTEVFLNFAEASNEAFGPRVKGTYKDAEGNTQSFQYSAYDVIKTIRSASGGITSTEYLDKMASSKEGMRKLIQNERRIELAFENHRYFDMRRWVLPLNESVRGVAVTVAADGTASYDTSVVVDERKFDGVKNYYAPIPYAEIVKCPNMVNNLGWR